MRLILATDLHITKDSTVENSQWVDHFCDFLLMKYDPETIIVFLGDIINQGNKDCFSAADRIFAHIESRLSTINYKLGFIPGNHDYCDKSLDAFNAFCAKHQTLIKKGTDYSSSKAFEYCSSDGRCNIILTDSIQNGMHNKPGSLDLNEICGCIVPGKTNILLLHHSLRNEDAYDHTGIIDQPQAEKFVNDFGIEFVFHGHAHCTRDSDFGKRTKMFGIGSLGLDAENLKGTYNEQEQFLEVRINNGFVESVKGWQWRMRGAYFPEQRYPQLKNDYAPSDSVARIEYKKPADYIDRFVMEYSTGSDPFFRGLYNSEKEPLYDVCKNNNRVLLIADAGMGKSVEMDNLAYRTSEINPYLRPVLLKLNHFKHRDIMDFIQHFYPQYQSLDPEQFLLVLDGYDELKNQKDFKQAINEFLEQFPQVHVCIAMRSNFLPQNSEVFDGFLPYRLLELSDSDVNTYIEDAGIDRHAFIKECQTKGVASFLHNPFYLKMIVGVYLSDKQVFDLPLLLNRILDDGYSRDARKFEYVDGISVGDNKYTWKRALTRFAYGLQLLHSVSCDSDTFVSIMEEDDITLLNQSAVVVNNNGERTFSHNLFREFLLANWLKDSTIEEIAEIAATPAKTCIYPMWYNTIGLILQMNGSAELIDMIFEIEPLLLTKLDRGNVSADMRFSLLEHFVNKIERENVWFEKGKCSEEELGSFAQSQRALAFLLEHIEHPKHFRGLYFCLSILQGFSRLYGQDETVRRILIKCYQSNEVRPHEKDLAINVIASLGLDNPEITGDLINRFGEDSDPFERHGVYSYLIESGSVNENYKYLLDGLHCISRGGVEEYRLTEGLSYITDEDAILDSIAWFAKGDNMHIEIFQIEQFIERIFSSATTIFGDRKADVFAAVYSFFVSAIKEYSNKRIFQAIGFFKSTGSFMEALRKLFSEEESSKHFYIWEHEIDNPDEFIKMLCELYKEDKLIDPNRLTLFTYTWRDNENIFNMIDAAVYEKTGNHIEPPRPIFDYKEYDKKDLQVFFDALFDKSKMVELAEKLIEAYNDPELKCDEIRNRYFEYEQYPAGTRRLSMRLCREWLKDIKVADAFDHINWEVFFVDSICNILKNESNNRPVISEAQMMVIMETYNDLLIHIDFHTAYQEKDNNHYTFAPALYWCNVLRTTLNLPAPKEYLIGLIECPYSLIHGFSGVEEKFNMIEERLGKASIVDRIGELIDDETRIDLLSEYLYAAKRYSMHGCTGAAIRLCKMNTLSFNKRFALEYLKNKEGSRYIIENVLPEADEDLFKVIAFLLYTERDPDLVSAMERMFEITHNQDILSKLVWLGSAKALQYYLEESRRNHRPLDAEHSYPSITESIRGISDPKTIPQLEKLLRLCFEDGFEDNEIPSLYYSLYCAFKNCAVIDYDNVMNTLHQLIDEASQNSEMIGFCYSAIRDIEDERAHNTACERKPSEVRKILKTLEV